MLMPRNVRLFAALLYASLGLDALSVAFQDRTPTGAITEDVILMANIVAAALIMVLLVVAGTFTWVERRLLGAVAHGDADRDQAVLGREQARASGLE